MNAHRVALSSAAALLALAACSKNATPASRAGSRPIWSSSVPTSRAGSRR